MQLRRKQNKEGIDGGLNRVKFTMLQCSNLFIDKKEGCDFLGVQPDDIESAIGDSVKLCADILDNKAGKIVAMKGE